MAWTFYDANGNSLQLTGAHTLGSHTGTLAIASGGTASVNAPAALEALGVGETDSPQFVDLTLTNDLLVNSGGIINFNSTDMTITHSSNALTVAGGTFATAALTTSTIVASAGITGTQVDILAQGDLRLQDTSGNQYVAFQAAGTTTTHTLTFPAAVATTAGDVLSSSTGGVLSWTTLSAGVGLGLVIALG